VLYVIQRSFIEDLVGVGIIVRAGGFVDLFLMQKLRVAPHRATQEHSARKQK
jgi:hypothetical protein